ncbi:MAG: hypothetical protein NTAFB09_02540 [Nitrosospira sp.]
MKTFQVQLTPLMHGRDNGNQASSDYGTMHDSTLKKRPFYLNLVPLNIIPDWGRTPPHLSTAKNQELAEEQERAARDFPLQYTASVMKR